MMIRTLIVDDERLARVELKNQLEHFQDIEVVGEAAHAAEARTLLKDHEVDLILLDIQMPGETGFEMLSSLDSCPYVIFTSAYDEYALKAFEFNALDYLLKPVEKERLETALNRLRESIKEDSQVVEAPVNGRDKLRKHDKVFVKDNNRCWLLPLGDVNYFESDGNYVKIFFDGNRPMIHRSLNALEEKLEPTEFFRASRKHIINVHKVTNIEPYFNGGLIATLEDGKKIEISRRQSLRFRELMSI